MIPALGLLALVLAVTFVLRRPKGRRRWSLVWATGLVGVFAWSIITYSQWQGLDPTTSSPSASHMALSDARIVEDSRFFFDVADTDQTRTMEISDRLWVATGQPGRIDEVTVCSDRSIVLIEVCRKETLIVVREGVADMLESLGVQRTF